MVGVREYFFNLNKYNLYKKAFAFLLSIKVLFSTLNFQAKAVCVSGQTIDILVLGNSYSAGTVPHLNNFLTAAGTACGATFNLVSNTPGGQTILGHTGSATTMNLVASGTFEHIILQEQSTRHLTNWNAANTVAGYTQEAESTTVFNDGRYMISSRTPWEQVTQAQYLTGTIPNTNVETYEYYNADGTQWGPDWKYEYTGYFNRTIYYTDGTTQTSRWGDSYVNDYQPIVNSAINANIDTEIHLFQTWGRAPATTSEDFNDDHLAANVAVSSILETYFADLGIDIDVSRVGEAWELIQNANGTNLYAGDGSHGNALGYYLSAATIFQEIIGEHCPSCQVDDIGYNPFGQLGTDLMNAAIALHPVPEPTSTVSIIFATFILFSRRKRTVV